ncbi:MAG: hypothetical protein WCT77_05850 [Bacteroidota bacterium]
MVKGISKTGNVWRLKKCNTCIEHQRNISDPERKIKREKRKTKDQLRTKWNKRDRRYIETLHPIYIKSLLRKRGLPQDENMIKLFTELLTLKRNIKKLEKNENVS